MASIDPLAIAALVGFVVLIGITAGITVWLIGKARLPAVETTKAADS